MPASDDLALTALRFAAGELPADRAEAFAERMAHDQDARDALADAIRLSAAALGQTAPAPDALIRAAVRDELRPTVWSRLVRRRPYRGHPAAWAGLGGAAVAGMVMIGVRLAEPPTREQPAAGVPAVRPDVAVEAPKPPVVGTGEPVRVAVEIAPPPVVVQPVEVPPPTAVAVQPPPEPSGAPDAKVSDRPNEIRATEP